MMFQDVSLLFVNYIRSRLGAAIHVPVADGHSGAIEAGFSVNVSKPVVSDNRILISLSDLASLLTTCIYNCLTLKQLCYLDTVID